MIDDKQWYVRTEDGKVYGPATIASLASWARDGRVEPTSFLSKDRKSWIPAQLMPELEMKWLVETEPGKVYGPFNRAVVIKLFKDGVVPEGAKAYSRHEFAVDQDPPPVEKIVEKIVEKRVEVPVEKIVEKIVEVPPPARTEIVTAEVVEPEADIPPPKIGASIFGKNVGRNQLAALEEAARRELAAAKMRRAPFRLFGGKGR